ncbi:hypothetical protein NONO_c60380 [Nocardia nova SH22a]|uniref:Uncharacterized protein n=1 Tax=Nocardia nova SH22a TaxID=1415166 RepID=W5TNS4_9NOCA|nr:hypothetical protein [Nocardia nova]AHH20814.1 hypothetical protein NONO_c60380 [Nocardia nova SH22a]
MIDVEAVMALHFERLKVPADALNGDNTYHVQIHWLRDITRRLGIILEDESIPDEVAERIVRGVLYGAPTDEAARLRMRQQDDRMRWLREHTTLGAPVVDDLLGRKSGRE